MELLQTPMSENSYLKVPKMIGHTQIGIFWFTFYKGYRVDVCDTRSSAYTTWMSIQIGYVVFLMFGCLIEGFRTRNTPAAFNESHHIFLCTVVFFIFAVLVVPVQVRILFKCVIMKWNYTCRETCIVSQISRYLLSLNLSLFYCATFVCVFSLSFKMIWMLLH